MHADNQDHFREAAAARPKRIKLLAVVLVMMLLASMVYAVAKAQHNVALQQAANAHQSSLQARVNTAQVTPRSGLNQGGTNQVVGSTLLTNTADPQTLKQVVPITEVQMVPDPDHPGKLKEQTTVRWETRGYSVSGSASPATPLDSETAELVSKLRQTSEQERDAKSLQRLRELLSTEFKARHQQQLARLERIKTEIERTEQILQQREQQQTQIVDRRLAELLGGRDPLNWDFQPEVPVYPVPSVMTPQNGYSVIRPLDVYAPVPNATVPNTGVWGQPNQSVYVNPRGTQFPVAPGASTPYGQLPPVGSSGYGPTTIPGLPTPARPPAVATIPPTVGTTATDPLAPLSPVAELPTAAELPAEGQPALASTASEMVGLGYKWRQLTEEAAQADALHEKQAISNREWQRHRTALEQFAAKWQFKRQELEKRLRIAELEWNDALGRVHRALELKKLGGSPQELREAEKAEAIAAIELKWLATQVEWAMQFEETMNVSQIEAQKAERAQEKLPASDSDPARGEPTDPPPAAVESPQVEKASSALPEPEGT